MLRNHIVSEFTGMPTKQKDRHRNKLLHYKICSNTKQEWERKENIKSTQRSNNNRRAIVVYLSKAWTSALGMS